MLYVIEKRLNAGYPFKADGRRYTLVEAEADHKYWERVGWETRIVEVRAE